MTTNYPSGPTPPNPAGPGNLPPGRDPAWGCAWWWILILIIIVLIIWWAGWGWGPSGGYWFRTRPTTTQPVRVAPSTAPAVVTSPLL